MVETWFVKVIRSGARDAEGNLPPDVWREGVVHPTVNAFDCGDTRAVVAVLQDDQPIRRLSPREHEALQGFPEDWTASQSDSSRYKQMGNAVAIPCVDWIVKRLVECDAR